MGVGTPADSVEGVAQGVDMFECVMPTRNARNGHLFIRLDNLKVGNTRHREDPWPIDETATAGGSWSGPNIINAVAQPSSLALASLALMSAAALRRKTHRPALPAALVPASAAQFWRCVRPPATVPVPTARR